MPLYLGKRWEGQEPPSRRCPRCGWITFIPGRVDAGTCPLCDEAPADD